MKHFIKLLVFTVTVWLGFGIASAKQGIVAVVNDDLLTDVDVVKRAELIINSNGMQKDAKTLSVIKNHALFTLIDEKLIKDEAKRLEISADDAELNFAMQSIADKNGIKMSQLRSHMKSININPDELEKQVMHQLLWNKIVHMRIDPKIYISDREVNEHKKAIIKHFKELKTHDAKELDLSEIVLYFSEEDGAVHKIKQLAGQIYAELQQGKKFSTLAKQFSQNSTAESGGKIGWIYTSQIRPEIANAVKSIKKGSFTGPLVLEDGIRIIQLNDRRGFKALKEDEISDDNIRQVIHNKKLEIQMQAYLRKLRRDGYINIK